MIHAKKNNNSYFFFLQNAQKEVSTNVDIQIHYNLKVHTVQSDNIDSNFKTFVGELLFICLKTNYSV